MRINDSQWQWLVGALVIISKQVNDVQRKLDALLKASTNVSTEQLTELTKDSEALQAKTEALAKILEQQPK